MVSPFTPGEVFFARRRIFKTVSILVFLKTEKILSIGKYGISFYLIYRKCYFSDNPKYSLTIIGNHSVSLFTGQECPKISMTSNPRQNCRIGQLTTKKWFFSPDQFGLRRKRKGKSGEIRSLLETLGSTL